MAEPNSDATRPTDSVGRALFVVAKILALFGGIVAGAMAVLTTASVAARAILGAPIPGDYELVGIMNGVAVFAFLPYCQITHSNIVVDFFMAGASARAKAICDTIGSLLFLALGCLLTWRLIYGAIDMHKYAEATPTLSIPRWLTFPFDIGCMFVLIAVTAYTLFEAYSQALRPTPVGHSGQGE